MISGFSRDGVPWAGLGAEPHILFRHPALWVMAISCLPKGQGVRLSSRAKIGWGKILDRFYETIRALECGMECRLGWRRSRLSFGPRHSSRRGASSAQNHGGDPHRTPWHALACGLSKKKPIFVMKSGGAKREASNGHPHGPKLCQMRWLKTEPFHLAHDSFIVVNIMQVTDMGLVTGIRENLIEPLHDQLLGQRRIPRPQFFPGNKCHHAMG